MTTVENENYTVGLDFGTLSVRAAVVRTSDGAVIADAVSEYHHGVMDEVLGAGDGQVLPPDFALQVPSDYLHSMIAATKEAVAASHVRPEDIVGLGLDVTSATVVVTDESGTPLCELDEFTNEPHAYIKLWKHHGAGEQVERIVALAHERGEAWIDRYGGTLSSEMLTPKALELLEKAPDVYNRAAEIMNMLDWLTWRLTGELKYSASDSGYKRLYQDGEYPSKEFLAALNPDFAEVFSEKMSHPVVALGERLGGLTPEFARELGLPEGIAVATGNIDAHVHAASVNAVAPGQMTGIVGTSTCWVLPSDHFAVVPGVFGVVDGGVSEGTWGYEAGQSAVGDIFAWFVENCVPESYHEQARERGLSLHEFLTEKAAAQPVGAHGLVALDWWNGNRSILVDSGLSGLMVGMTLATKPEDQYRALLEATAFGARVIIDNFEQHGISVDEIRIAGGLLKNPLLMQIYADVTRRPLSIATVTQAGAHGSAIFAAVAAGVYPSLAQAAVHMGGVISNAYVPNEEASQRYDELFAIYLHLYDLFGRSDETMHELRQIRDRARA